MRNYVIIGGSSGIGNAIVESLEEGDANITATYHNNAKESRPKVKYLKLDATTDELDLNELPEQIHGLAYCPGSVNLKPFKRFKEEDLIQDFKLQVTGATKVIQQLLPRMKHDQDISILLFSTVAVQTGFSFHTQVAISKGAIEGLTRSLAAELSPDIRVNAIAPSLTNTNLTARLLSSPEKIQAQSDRNPMKRIGDPKDIAEAAVYLLTERSSWVTGQIITVDGGSTKIKK